MIGFSPPPELPTPGIDRLWLVPDAVEVRPAEGVRPDRLGAWQAARALLGNLKPTPEDVLALADFLATEDKPAAPKADEPDEDEDDDEEEDDEPDAGDIAFALAVELLDRWPPVKLLRRFLA